MANKDWTGNANSIWKTLGASNHTDKERQNEDYYATDPIAAEWLLKIEEIPKDKPIWECAAGEKHLSKVFEEHGYKVRSSDLIVRIEDVEQLDFLTSNETWDGTIITNPPYNQAVNFIQKAMESITEGNKVIMFLKVQFLEGKSRKKLFEKYPPKTVWVSSSRITCAKNGDFEYMKANGGSAVAYAFYVWQKGYKGDTILKWFN
jgi:hypothetical protein